MRSCRIVAGLAAASLLAACGSGARQDASEPSGDFPMQASAKWSSSQHLSQHSVLVITATNTGTKTVPDVAVTICNISCSPSASALQKGQGSSVHAFATKLNQAGLASTSRPVWIIDQAPGPKGGPCPSVNANASPNGAYNNNYSACTGGPGGAATAYANTWALGSLAPGQTATFAWHLTAVQSGTHVVRWQVAAGLNGKARAVGGPTDGTFTVNISQRPQQAFVDNNGKVVTTP
jgi:hypothetical protein